jgi:nucleoside-diphosphate-sugar epimerase
VLVAAKECGVKKVVYASSSSIYGDTPTLPKVFTSDIKELIQDHLETPPRKSYYSDKDTAKYRATQLQI